LVVTVKLSEAVNEIDPTSGSYLVCADWATWIM